MTERHAPRFCFHASFYTELDKVIKKQNLHHTGDQLIRVLYLCTGPSLGKRTKQLGCYLRFSVLLTRLKKSTSLLQRLVKVNDMPNMFVAGTFNFI